MFYICKLFWLSM